MEASGVVGEAAADRISYKYIWRWKMIIPGYKICVHPYMISRNKMIKLKQRAP